MNAADEVRLGKAGPAFWAKVIENKSHMSRDEALEGAGQSGYKNPHLAIASHIRWEWLEPDGDGYSTTKKADKRNAAIYLAHRAEKKG